MKKILFGLFLTLFGFAAQAQVQPLSTFVFPYGAVLCGGGRFTISDCTKLSGPISTPSFPSLKITGAVTASSFTANTTTGNSYTFTGGNIDQSGNINALSLNVTGITAPANGMWQPQSNTLGLISSGSANGIFIGSVGATIGQSIGNINSTDLFNIRGGQNAAISFSMRNNSTGTAAQNQINLANNTSNTEVQMTLNGGAFSGGLGANAFNINAKDGQIVLQTASTSAITISNGQVVALPAITTDNTHTDATVCEDTTTHALFFGSGAAGICLGTSSKRYKHDIKKLDVGINQIMKLEPVKYKLNADKGDPNKILYGFTAEQGSQILPQLVGYDIENRPNTFDYVGVVPVLVKAIQQQQIKIAKLEKQIKYKKVH